MFPLEMIILQMLFKMFDVKHFFSIIIIYILRTKKTKTVKAAGTKI